MQKKDIKILVVEDQPSIRARLVGYLYNQGYMVRGDAGCLREIGAFHPDLILMDTGLPGALGYERCREIRQKGYGQNIAIMGMSNDNCHEEWFNAGADSFISKHDFMNRFYSDTGKSDKWRFLEEKIEQVLKKYGKL